MKKTPPTFTFIVRFQSSSDVSMPLARTMMPAALTSPSIRPADEIRAMASSQNAAWLISPTMASALKAAAVAAASSALRSMMKTRAPDSMNSRAHYAPMPLAPPVTAMTLPVKEDDVLLLMVVCRKFKMKSRWPLRRRGKWRRLKGKGASSILNVKDVWQSNGK
jgi:hypothetical protein